MVLLYHYKIIKIRGEFTYIYTSGDYLSEDDKICEKYISRLSKLYGISEFSTISAEGLDIDTNCADSIINEICNKLKNNK